MINILVTIVCLFTDSKRHSKVHLAKIKTKDQTIRERKKINKMIMIHSLPNGIS
jgi:hypothetical protein